MLLGRSTRHLQKEVSSGNIGRLGIPFPLALMHSSSPQPKRLGKYEVNGTIALGPRWRIYKGFDPTSQLQVALKTISKDLLDRSGVFSQMRCVPCTRRDIGLSLVERFAKFSVFLPIRMASSLGMTWRLGALNPALRAHVDS